MKQNHIILMYPREITKYIEKSVPVISKVVWYIEGGLYLRKELSLSSAHCGNFHNMRILSIMKIRNGLKYEICGHCST